MTDGILLAELQRDRQLRKYDTIIIDEAHERSLNIDFLLGYLKRLLPQAARPQADHHLGDHRRGPVREALRRAGRRGLRADLPGRGPLPAADGPRRGGRGGRGRRPRPDRGDRRRGQGALGRGARRHPGVPARRAGDPRHRRRDEGPAAHRDRAALLAALGRRAAPGLLVPRRLGAPRRARHQRRRDLADRARHPVRRRHRRRADQPLLGAHQGAAAADRADQPGLGQPALRPLRPGRGGHRRTPLLRGGLRRPPGVHRPGDPAHQPGQRHPADDLPRARRHRAGSRSSSRRTSATSAPACSCSRSSAR